MIDRRTFVAIAGGALLGVTPDLRAQGKASMRRIGFLSPFARAEVEVFVGELKPELEKLGRTEGRNIELLEVRTTEEGMIACRSWRPNSSPSVPTSSSSRAFRPLARSCRRRNRYRS